MNTSSPQLTMAEVLDMIHRTFLSLSRASSSPCLVQTTAELCLLFYLPSPWKLSPIEPLNSTFTKLHVATNETDIPGGVPVASFATQRPLIFRRRASHDACSVTQPQNFCEVIRVLGLCYWIGALSGVIKRSKSALNKCCYMVISLSRIVVMRR